MKRLSGASGGVADNSPKESDTDSEIVRPAILVHVGKFQSGDGPIDFDEMRIKRVVENQNKKLSALAADYGGLDKMPAGAWTPILDQHADDSNDRLVGRYASLLRAEQRDIPGVGKNVWCAVADIRFLGKDTVAKVKDGRIYHLSIGIDEKTDTLGETSTVIEPAAPGAMLLKKGEKPKPKGDRKMADNKQYTRMKARAERMTKLAALKGEIESTNTKLVASKEVVRMAKRQGDVESKLMQLMKGGKMTPAEFKNLDIKKLAKLDDESLPIALSAFSSREKPVIDPAQRGSTDAQAFSEVGKNLEKSQYKRLKAESIRDIKRLTGGKVKMKFEDAGEDEDAPAKMSGPKEEIINPGKDEHVVPDQAGDEKQLAGHHAHLKACLEAGDVAGAKDAHEKIMAHHEKHGMKHMEMGDVKSEDYSKGMGDMESRVDELSTQMARMSSMLGELMSAEEEEGHDLESGEEEHPSGQAAAG